MSGMKKGLAVWIFGFFTILAFVNVFNSAMMWMQNGDAFLFTPYLIGQFIGPLQVTQYFWISIAVGFLFSGCMTFTAFWKQNEIEITNALKGQRTALDKFFEVYRTNLKSHELLKSHIDITAQQNQKRLRDFIGDLGMQLSGAIKRETFAKKLDRFIKTNAKQEETNTARVEQFSKTIETLQHDFADMRKGFQSLENAILSPLSKLTVESSPKEIVGIGPRIAKELENIGITNVGDFLFTDPAIIDGNTHLSLDQVERLQGTAQLLMIPGIDDTDIELFQKMGVTNRKELAVQDPFEFNIRLLNTYAKSGQHLKYKKPRFEEVLSWVRTAQL